MAPGGQDEGESRRTDLASASGPVSPREGAEEEEQEEEAKSLERRKQQLRESENENVRLREANGHLTRQIQDLQTDLQFWQNQYQRLQNRNDRLQNRNDRLQASLENLIANMGGRQQGRMQQQIPQGQTQRNDDAPTGPAADLNAMVNGALDEAVVQEVLGALAPPDTDRPGQQDNAQVTYHAQHVTTTL